MRHCINPSVRAIMEELQGQTVVPTAPSTIQAPANKKQQPAAAGAQQVAAGVQQAATGAAQAAATTAADGVRQEVAQQQGTNPANQQQANRVAAVQPRQPQVTPQAQARGTQNDAMANRRAGIAGKPVVAAEGTAEPPLPKGTPKEAANADEKADFNGQDEQTKRARERAAEIDVKSAGPNKTSTMSEKGPGKPQTWKEVTKQFDMVTKKTEEGVAAPSTLSDDERNDILDGVFG